MPVRLKRRRRPGPRPVGAAANTLSDLRRGEVARIVEVRDDGDPATARRMVALGFEPGVEVRMVRRAPMADPVVFQVAGTEVALRRAQARCIYVSTLS